MAEAKPPQAIQAPALGIARIAGRIEAARQKSTASGKLFLTLMRLPAPDSYSSPSTVEVRSNERVGAVGDEVSILVKLGGYGRSYDDKEGGKVRTAENALDFIEHA